MNLTVNINDTSSYPALVLMAGTGLSITIGSTTVTGVSTSTEVVSDNSQVTIIVSKTGYNSYTNTINVFVDDLTVELFLVPVITNPSDPNYNRPYTYFNSYVKPCSYNIYLVDGSSLITPVNNYYINTILQNSDDRNYITTQLCPETVEITFTKTKGSYTESFSRDVTINEYKPSLSLDVSVTDNACSGGDCDCILIESTINVIPNFILNDEDCPNVLVNPTNLKTNGDFSVNNTGWTYIDTTPFNNSPLGSYVFEWLGDFSHLERRGIISTDSLVIGKQYQITFTLSDYTTTGGFVAFRLVDDVNTFANIYYQILGVTTANEGSITVVFTAAATTLGFVFSASAGNHFITISNVDINATIEGSITYNLFDYNETLVDTLSYDITDSTLPQDIPYTYTLNNIGDYTLQTLLSNCCVTCEKDTILHLCDFIKITETGCHTYNLQNCSGLDSKDSTYIIYDLDDNTIQSGSLLHGGGITTFTSTKDNVYKLVVSNSDNVVIRIYILIDICTIKNCITSRILNLFCKCKCKEHHSHSDKRHLKTNNCDKCEKEREELNRINILWFDLANRINKEYKLNSYYSTLDNATINSLKTTKDIISKLLEYCDCCGDGSKVNFNTVGSITKSDCGCS